MNWRQLRLAINSRLNRPTIGIRPPTKVRVHLPHLPHAPAYSLVYNQRHNRDIDNVTWNKTSRVDVIVLSHNIIHLIDQEKKNHDDSKS